MIVATKGRPQAVAQLLRLLERQTLPPSLVLISATEGGDVEGSTDTVLPVEYLFGPPGSSRQRNRALERGRDGADIIVFFDDDFAPGPTWLAHCASVFESQPEVVGMSGWVLRDGAPTPEISWEEAQRLIEQSPAAAPAAAELMERNGLYGCNMAFRAASIADLSFDERLVLYGWMEDKDFSRRAGRRGRLVRSTALTGVHLGLKSGRVSGRRFGYSQIVNAWYLRQKGVLSAGEAWGNITKALLSNSVKSLWPEGHIDRLGRFQGNLIGVGNLLRGRCRPETAAEL